MAENKPTATNVSAAKAPTSVQPKKKSNLISWIAPFLCLLIGYSIWRFLLGHPSNFTDPDLSGGFWPKHHGPTSALTRMYEGGIVVPVLIACFVIVTTFTVEKIGRASCRERVKMTEVADLL